MLLQLGRTRFALTVITGTIPKSRVKILKDLVRPIHHQSSSMMGGESMDSSSDSTNRREPGSLPVDTGNSNISSKCRDKFDGHGAFLISILMLNLWG